MTEWKTGISNERPPKLVKEKHGYLQYENIHAFSDAVTGETMYSYMYRRLSFPEYANSKRTAEDVRPLTENVKTVMDSNDTTIMGAQADTYEQVLGIDDVMEALADIYTEILEIKERL